MSRTKEVTAVHLFALGLILVAVISCIPIGFGQDQSNRVYSFITDGLGLGSASNKLESVANDSFTYINYTGTWVTFQSSAYIVESGGARVAFNASYRDDSNGIVWLTMVVNGSSNSIPSCLQTSTRPNDRALDLIRRYQSWVGETDLNYLVKTLTGTQEIANETASNRHWSPVNRKCTS